MIAKTLRQRSPDIKKEDLIAALTLKSISKKLQFFGVSASNFKSIEEKKLSRIKEKYNENTIDTKKVLKQVHKAIIQILNIIVKSQLSKTENKIGSLIIEHKDSSVGRFDLYVNMNTVYIKVSEDEEKFLLFKFDDKYSFLDLKKKISFALSEDYRFISQSNTISPRIERFIITLLQILCTHLGAWSCLTLVFASNSAKSFSLQDFMVIFFVGSALGFGIGEFLKYKLEDRIIIDNVNSEYENRKNYLSWLLATNRVPFITVGELKKKLIKTVVEDDSVTATNGKVVLHLKNPLTHESLENYKDQVKIVLIPRSSEATQAGAKHYDIYAIEDLSSESASIAELKEANGGLIYRFKMYMNFVQNTDFMTTHKFDKLSFNC